MTKQVINVGTAANDKKGDSLRAAFQKVNANFTELYTALGINADGNLNIGAFEFTGSVMSTTDSTPIVIDQAVSVTSDLTVGGDIVPNIANGGNLGSLDRPFRSLYVSNSTVFLGGVPLSLDPNTNELNINNVPISQTINYSDIPNVPTDVSDLTDDDGLLGGGGGNPFDQDLNTDDSVTFNSVGTTTVNVSQINGTNPGDELVIQANNNNWNFGADGTLTLPNGSTIGDGDAVSGVPITTTRGSILIGNQAECLGGENHFHIMKAGQQDIDLFLGDDNNYVKLPSTGGVEISSSEIGAQHYWTFGADGKLNLPEGGDILNSNGDSVLGGGSSTVVRQDTPPSADNGTLWFNTVEGRLYIKYSDAWIDAAPLMTPAPDTDIDVASITFPDASVQTTAFTGTALTDRLVNGVNELVLESNGNLTIPGAITNDNGIEMITDRGTVQFGYNLEVPGVASHFHINKVGSFDLFLGDDSDYVKLPSNGGVEIQSGQGLWTFGTDGALTVPGDIRSEGNVNIEVNLSDSTLRRWSFGEDGDLTLPAGGDILDSNGNSVLGGGSGDNNIWVQTFLSNEPAVDFPNIAISVEYDSEGNVIALFLHTIDLTGERYFTVGKYTAAGTKIWTARLSDDSTTDGWGLAVDNAGGWIYVAGAVDGGGYPYRQATLTKIDAATGGVEWYRIYDFGYDSSSAVVDVDSAGHPVMVGYVDIDPDVFAQESYLTITKVNKTTGAVTWSRKLDGQANEQAYGMAVGPTGEVVAVGYMDQLTGVDTDDRMVVVKYASDGTIDWQRAIQFDEGWDCTGADADIDSQGNVYICGQYTFEFNGGPGTGSAIGIVKLDSSGVKQWSRRVVGDCISLATSIVVGPDDKLYISGVTGNEVENIAFKWLVAKFDFDGLVEWQRFIENTVTWTFSGQFFGAEGGGSNLAVRQGYVALAGGFGNLEAGDEPLAAVLQVSSTGNVFSVGNWNFTSSSLSSILNSTASDITVINAGLTDTDNASAITSSVVGITTEVGNFLIGTVLTAPGGNDSLVNGAYSVSLSNTGVVILPAGGTITEGYVTSNPTIQLTPASPDVASQKLVIKGGGAYTYTDNGISINYNNNTAIVGNTLTFYINSNTYADQTLYWWIHPSGANISDPGLGTVAVNEFGYGEFSFLLDSDDNEFTVRVSPEDNNYDPASLGVETGLINADAPTFDSEHHLHLTTGNLAETSIFLGTDDQNVRTTVNGGIEITTTDGSYNVWQFGTDGSLTLPIGVSIDSNVSSLYPKIIADSGKLFSVQGQGSTGSAALAWSLDPNTDTQYAAVGVNKGGGDNLAKVVLTAGNTTATLKVWKFDETGALTFPDGTIQTTAPAFSFSVAADDSTQRAISDNESIKFIGAGGVTTASDAEGNITITGSKVIGEWAVTTGTNTYSFTVPSDGTYVMWVKGNIPNGIITWNATLSISNSNVPAIGTQYAWNYTGGGSPILLTSIPDQIKGVAGTISTDNTYVGTTSNRFDFGISNTSGSTRTIYYGYTKIS